MKKISFVGLLFAVMAFIIPQNAFAQEVGKWYRLKNANTGYYLAFTNHTSYSTSPRNDAGMGVVGKDESSADQIFKLETATGSKYYIVSYSGYYIYCTYWQCHAQKSQRTQFSVSQNGSNYTIFQQESNAEGTYFHGYVAPQATGSGQKVYCDNSSAENYGKWQLEEVTQLPELPEEELVYCTYTQSRNRDDRKLSSFTLTDGANSVTVSSIQPYASSAVYKDATSSKLTTTAGATISFSELTWAGEWMHGYLFVDYDKDGAFNSTLNADGTTGGEVVSYNYYGGKNSKGVTTQNNCAVRLDNMPSFTLPSNLAAGKYRLRFNIAWDTKDACGYSSMGTDGGAMVDITLVVESAVVPSYEVTVSSSNTDMGTASKQAGENDAFTLTASAKNGYEFVNWTVAGAEVSTANPYTFTATENVEVVANFQAVQEWPATMELIATAQTLIAYEGVGYPNATAKAELQAAISAAQANTTIASVAPMQEAINAFYTTSEIEMPVAGKAYAFVPAISTSNLYYIYNNTANGQLALASYTTGNEIPEAAKFICAEDNGKYYFQSVVDNKYMAYPVIGGKDWLTGESETGLEVEAGATSKFEIRNIYANMNSNVTAATNEQLFGMVYLWGYRGVDTSKGDSYVAIVVKTGGTWDAAGEPFCNGTVTSAIKMVEVDYVAPTPVYAVSAEASPAEAGNVTISSEEVEENGTVELNAVANAGYEFVNWTVGGVEVSAEAAFTATVTAETAYVANFVAKEFTITYKVDGEVYATETYAFGATVAAQADPTKEGYTFSGWSEIPETMPAENVTVTGSFAVNSYDVVYKVDGEVYATDTYAYGAEVVAQAEPTKAGYTFSGWSAIPETMPANDVEVIGSFSEIIKENKEIADDNNVETADAYYANVTVANEKVWDIKANTISADKVSVSVSATGAAPQIKIQDGGQVTTDLEVNRIVKKGEWAMMALPFAVDLDYVTVNGVAAQNGVNIKVMVYDAAKRAEESIELWTKSGWVDLQGTTIAANQGFAVAVNAQNGDMQTVTFAATTQTYDGSDKAVALDRHESRVNEGADADWNFFGNPTLANAEKGTGYALYIYNAEDDSYDEYASSDAVICQPYAAMFVQSADGFNSLNFSAGTAGALADANGVYGEMQFSLNGEDEARVLLVDEASEEYVRNEDALYFAAPNANLAQLYIVKGNIKMAVSEQPALSESMALGYKAAKAGVQTLTLTSMPENANVVLKDNVTGDEVALTVGDSYSFESAAGTFNNRFVVTTTDLTGIAQATTNGDVKVVVNGDEIIVYGVEAGVEVAAYATNGVVVASAVATEGATTLATSATGVIVVKVADAAIKVIK